LLGDTIAAYLLGVRFASGATLLHTPKRMPFNYQIEPENERVNIVITNKIGVVDTDPITSRLAGRI
jgi:hypothetical protein